MFSQSGARSFFRSSGWRLFSNDRAAGGRPEASVSLEKLQNERDKPRRGFIRPYGLLLIRNYRTFLFAPPLPYVETLLLARNSGGSQSRARAVFFSLEVDVLERGIARNVMSAPDTAARES